MMLAQKLLSSLSGAVSDPLYVDDVFSAYTYTGTDTTLAVNNGIDLAGKGGMVWLKSRTAAAANYHCLIDTNRGVRKTLFSNETSAEMLAPANYGLTAFAANGFTLQGNNKGENPIGSSVAWTFRKAPKFFDVVTWTGDGDLGRQISHALGVKPGMIIIKAISTTSNWAVWHRSAGGGDSSGLSLNSTSQNLYSGGQASVSTFRPGSMVDSNRTYTGINSGVTYVAYLFAHDPSADGIIQCGSYVGNGAEPGPTITLGWEPQYLLVKDASAAGHWHVFDTARGLDNSSIDAQLVSNISTAENATQKYTTPTATGFVVDRAEINTSGNTYIYLAIRRPNKPPTTGTQVYNAIARTGTSGITDVNGVGFAPDLVMSRARTINSAHEIVTKLIGNSTNCLYISNTSPESNDPDGVATFLQDGIRVGPSALFNNSSFPAITHFFKRAPGVFDAVCYTGTGGSQTISHNLTIKPEFLIIKGRTNTSGWFCTHKDAPNGSGGLLNTNLAFSDMLNSTQLKDGYCYLASVGNDGSTFSLTTGNTGVSNVNASAANYVAYLFATKAGISKVGSYTGNGTTQTINCGFTTGARFILIKRTDSTGDWYIWDTARGIISANDPHLSLNTPAAEVTTDDSVDPDVSGFIVNQVAATNINVSGGQYIFLAIA